MANVIYPLAKQAFLQGDLDLDGTVTVYLVDLADYTYSAAHQYLSSVPGAARVASANLASKTFTNGLFDAADTTMSAVTGDQCEALIVAQNTGTDATSRLVAYFDTGVTGFPITPNGSDVTVTWNASGIFQL